MTITMREKVKRALEKNIDTTTVDGLIALAYYVGKHDGAKEVCDTATKIFKIQKEKSSQVRYKHEALKVQGNISNIYHPDYSSDFPEFEVEELI